VNMRAEKAATSIFIDEAYRAERITRYREIIPVFCCQRTIGGVSVPLPASGPADSLQGEANAVSQPLSERSPGHRQKPQLPHCRSPTQMPNHACGGKRRLSWIGNLALSGPRLLPEHASVPPSN